MKKGGGAWKRLQCPLRQHSPDYYKPSSCTHSHSHSHSHGHCLYQEKDWNFFGFGFDQRRSNVEEAGLGHAATLFLPFAALLAPSFTSTHSQLCHHFLIFFPTQKKKKKSHFLILITKNKIYRWTKKSHILAINGFLILWRISTQQFMIELCLKIITKLYIQLR